MHKWNRALAAVLSAALVFTSTPAGVMAAETSDVAATGISEVETAEDQADAEEQIEIEEQAEVEEQTELVEPTEAEEQAETVIEEEMTSADSEDSAADTTEAESAEVIEEEVESDSEIVSDTNVAAAAQENDSEEQIKTEEVSYPGSIEIEEESYSIEDWDSDSVYEDYANRMFYGADSSNMKLKGITGNRLQNNNLSIYNALKKAAKEIADGEKDSAAIVITSADMGFKDHYTANDLGLEYLYDWSNEVWNPDLDNAIHNVYDFDFYTIFDCIFADCAYEVYWGNGGLKTVEQDLGIKINSNYVDFSNFHIEFDFGVNPKFNKASGDSLSIDTEKTGAVKTAVNTAKKIVANAAGKTDYYKLDYYKERICDLVVYNDEAAADSSSYTDRGPWALVYVFDGLDQTNVVCEGYAEAFQYLTELTEFSGDTYAYSVTGQMGGGQGAGGHKWNIVHIDGKNYIADITNSDAGTIGQDGDLFLKGMNGSVSDGYWKNIGSQQIYYVYYDRTLNIYDEEELTLSPTDYGVADPSTTDDKANLKGISIYLSDRIGMQIYVKTNAAVADTDFMEFSYAGKTVTQPVSDAAKKTITDFNGESIEVLVFELPLWSTEMTEEVSFRMSIGGVYGTPKTYSVREYADELLRGDQYEDKYKDMARVMLNYGGYSQEYFDYNMDKLANKDLYEEGQNPVPASTPDLSQFDYTFTVASDTQGFNLKQAALGLGDRIRLKFYYKMDAGKTLEDYVFEPAGSYTLDFEHDDEKGMDCVIVGGINPYELNNYYGFTVKSKSGTQLTQISYSPLSYCKDKIEKSSSDKIKNLCKALVSYWGQAKNLQ